MHGSLYSTIVEHEGGNKKLMANGCFQQVLRGSLGMVDGKVSKRKSLRGEKGEENILNGWRDPCNLIKWRRAIVHGLQSHHVVVSHERGKKKKTGKGYYLFTPS